MILILLILGGLPGVAWYLSTKIDGLKDQLREQENRNRAFRSLVFGCIPADQLPASWRKRTLEIAASHGASTAADAIERDLGLERAAAVDIVDRLMK